MSSFAGALPLSMCPAYKVPLPAAEKTINITVHDEV
jgi:hypothetical protein